MRTARHDGLVYLALVLRARLTALVEAIIGAARYREEAQMGTRCTARPTTLSCTYFTLALRARLAAPIEAMISAEAQTGRASAVYAPDTPMW